MQPASNVKWPRVGLTKTFDFAHLRLCEGGDFNKAAWTKLIKTVPEKRGLQLFFFVPVISDSLKYEINTAPDVAVAIEHMTSHPGPKMLARKLIGGDIDWDYLLPSSNQ